MDRLRPEDQKTLQLLFLKAKMLEDESERQADLEDYKLMQTFFAEKEERPKKISNIIFTPAAALNAEKLQVEESSSYMEPEEEQFVLDELQKELDQDELFTPADSEAANQKKCIMCSKVKAKYTCPGCSRRTCSLDCSKSHKSKFQCLGKQILTGFVSKGSYNEDTAKKDYRYLRETLEGTEFIRKKLSFANNHPELLRLKLLKIYSKKKHSIDLMFAPSIMLRHRENISFYYMKNKLVYWVIEAFLVHFKSLETTNEISLEKEQQQQQLAIGEAPRQTTTTTTKVEEKNVRKLIDPKAENLTWREVFCDYEVHLEDDALLLQEGIDFSAQGIANMIEKNQVKLFMKNRFQVSEILLAELSANNILQQQNKPECESVRPFRIPDFLRESIVPTEPQEKEALNAMFVSKYLMIEIEIRASIQDTLRGSKINEFPSMILVHEKFLPQFFSKYTCLQLS